MYYQKAHCGQPLIGISRERAQRKVVYRDSVTNELYKVDENVPIPSRYRREKEARKIDFSNLSGDSRGTSIRRKKNRAKNIYAD